jgi:uncharacterized membrane protein HdeD (DUF308 family)
MLDTLKRGWWLLVLRGACAILFGVLAFAYPGSAGQALVILFGAYALVNGISTIGLSARTPKGIPGKGTLLLLGLLGVAAGLVTFFYPGITAISLLSVIAFWAIVTGILEIWVAIALRKELSNEWMLILAGILSVVFGVLVVAMPSAGALSIIWLIGSYAILFGIMMLAVAFKVRSVASEVRNAARPA